MGSNVTPLPDKYRTKPKEILTISVRVYEGGGVVVNAPDTNGLPLEERIKAFAVHMDALATGMKVLAVEAMGIDTKTGRIH